MKEIPLSKGFMALIDDADYPLIADRPWHAVVRPRTVYAATTVKIGKNQWRTLFMHTLIMGKVEGKDIDHINHNGLDNRRENLRHATRSENLANMQRFRAKKSSKYKGVFGCRGYWLVKAGAEYVGCFKDEMTAALAYDKALKAKYGDFACLNFP